MLKKKIFLMPLTIVTIIILGVIAWLIASHIGRESATVDSERAEILEVQQENLSKGSDDADITIVEYVDILCPHCAKAHQEILPKIEAEYIEPGKASYEVRLVAKIAPDSARAAKGAYCAAEQDMLWKYLDTAYRITWNDYYSQNRDTEEIDLFSQTNIGQFSHQIIGLDKLAWTQCLESDRYDKTLEDNAQEMSDLKAYGTPHFIINGHDYNGAPPYEFFKTAIEAELRRKSEEG